MAYSGNQTKGRFVMLVTSVGLFSNSKSYKRTSLNKEKISSSENYGKTGLNEERIYL